MKKIVLGILIMSFVFFSFAEDIQEKPKVVFLKFKSVAINEEITTAVMENLLTPIIASNVFTVIERAQLNRIYEELKLTESDDFSDSTALEIGKLAKAKIVFLGSVTKMGSRITINVRGIEVETGIALFAENITTDSEDELPEAIDELADGISRIAASRNGQEYAESEDKNEDRREDSGEKRDDRRKRGRGGQGERLSADLIKEVDDVPFADRYGAEIVKQIPLELEGRVRAEHFVEENAKLFKLSSEMDGGRRVRWEYEFKILKDSKIENIERSPVINKLVIEAVKVPKKVQKDSGLYLVCTTKTPGNYTVLLIGKNFEALRTVFVSHPMETYFLPLSTFRVIQENRKQVRGYQPLTEKMLEGTLSIHIEKNFFQVLNDEVMEGKKYSNTFEMDEIGFFTYKLKKVRGVVATFDSPLDRTKVSTITAFAHRERTMTLYEALDKKVVTKLESGLDRQDGAAGDFFFLNLDLKEQQEDTEWGANIAFPLDFDISRYKYLSFLVRARGSGAFAVVLNSTEGAKFKPVFVPRDNWVRITIPLKDFESSREPSGDSGDGKSYLRFSINSTIIEVGSGQEQIDHIRFELDEIRFLP